MCQFDSIAARQVFPHLYLSARGEHEPLSEQQQVTRKIKLSHHLQVEKTFLEFTVQHSFPKLHEPAIQHEAASFNVKRRSGSRLHAAGCKLSLTHRDEVWGSSDYHSAVKCFISVTERSSLLLLCVFLNFVR